MQVVEYRGWPNNLLLSNGDVELIATLDVGPRVIAYRLPGGFNVMKNYDAMMGGTGEAEWQIRGGHRFWLAPEDLTRTYFPDNRPVRWEQVGPHAVKLTPPPEAEYGVQKEMFVALGDTGTKVTVRLRVTNTGTGPTDLAPWGPTVMAPGGVEVIPLPPKSPHPGHPSRAKSPADYAPNQELILWPYFDFTDPRWHFGSRYITLHQDAQRGPTKIGLSNGLGWTGYLNGGTLFVKRFPYHEGQPYPDGGCNYETFTNQEFLEMESLGPLVRLAPGAKVEHSEHWELHKDVHAFHSEEGINENVLPKVEGK